MSYLEHGGRRTTIPVGEVRIGSDPASHLALAGPGIAPRHAVIQGYADGQVVIRRASEDAEILVNGVRLGPQPTPLLHGDRVQIGSYEMVFVDERRSGSTQYVQAVDPSMLAAAKAPAAKPREATAATGGRVVSLTDGREYVVTGQSLVFGRDAACDVVITDKSVSRRHAEIMATPKGYVLIDSSTNGTFVNGERVQGQRLLARADVIRIGTDEFRFYADRAPQPVAASPPPVRPAAAPAAASPAPPAVAPPAVAPAPRAAPSPPPAAPAAAPVSVSPAAPQRPPAPPQPMPVSAPAGPGAPGAAEKQTEGVPLAPQRPQAQPPAAGRPAAPAAPPVSVSPAAPQRPAAQPAGGTVMANLVVRSGQLKGQRLPIRVPIVNVGRAEYNDIVLPDESVSTVHAKLQRREGVWVLVDLDSTNGSFVDAERVQGEMPLAPGALIRFGEVQVLFEPTDDTIDAARGSSTKLMSAIRLPPGAPPGPGAPGSQ
jgi:pSer/pThr/pTyr-binding forkhead associated (FHA) protein